MGRAEGGNKLTQGITKGSEWLELSEQEAMLTDGKLANSNLVLKTGERSARQN